MTENLRVQILDPNATAPARAHDGDAGFDLCANEHVLLEAGTHALIRTGVAIALPKGTVGLVSPRSGLAARNGVTVLNAPGIVDENYRGEVGVILINHGAEPFQVLPGMRIAQLVITPYLSPAVDVVDSLDDTDRGAGGFGSTGA